MCVYIYVFEFVYVHFMMYYTDKIGVLNYTESVLLD